MRERRGRVATCCQKEVNDIIPLERVRWRRNGEYSFEEEGYLVLKDVLI